MKTIVVTGGAGYIGAHAVKQLLRHNYTVVVIDDFSTGDVHNVPAGVKAEIGDFADPVIWNKITSEHEVFAVMHFAASIDAVESFSKPESYIENNATKTATLLALLHEHGITRFIFSSTAAVYGVGDGKPVREDAILAPINPYGYSKMLAEQSIAEASKMGLQCVILRYFNACGRDPEGRVSRYHKTALLAQLALVIQGKLAALPVYGDDYDTADGTCIRDFVHVVDIARAHIAALENIDRLPALSIFNIGTGTGYSVRQILDAAHKVLGIAIPITIQPRRENEVPVSIADASRIHSELGFNLKFSDVETILRTSL